MAAGTGRWVQVSSFATPGEAEAVATMLRAEGIEARIDDHDVPGLAGYETGMRTAAIYVHEPDLARAREALGSVSEEDLEAEALAAAPGEAGPAGGSGRAEEGDRASFGRSPLREAGGARGPARALGLALGAIAVLLLGRACAG